MVCVVLLLLNVPTNKAFIGSLVHRSTPVIEDDLERSGPSVCNRGVRVPINIGKHVLEDDTFVTDFGTKTVDGDLVEITWNKPLYFKLSNSRDPSTFSVYLMFCLNTESEISFID